LELDWLALRGVNLPLAWVGYEKILMDTFQEFGMTDSEILPFFSGPAFQAWNRFGNIEGSWGGGLPMEWIDGQFELQKNITARMVELGMTPVLPCITGFVPRAITRVLPNAMVVNGSQWDGFPVEYTKVTFLEPTDPAFAQLQKTFISKQAAAYGNITHIYTLDQYNENDPYSGDLDYLQNVSYSTWQSLKGADPEAIWLMQSWLFFENEAFWDNDRIEAYLGGVQNENDMVLLDVFSESAPQWQRTNSYFGKPWIWCQLHDYGQAMGLYGQIMNVTINPIDALANSTSLVGFGLTMEGQEGNEIMYDLLLDQAWSGSPIDTETYFHNWVTRRYAGNGSVPDQLYSGWETMRSTVYNNTDLNSAKAVTRSILELSPNITGLAGQTIEYGGTTVNYDPAMLVSVFHIMFDAAQTNPALWQNPAYQYDMVDITRQVYGNYFLTAYQSLVSIYNSSQYSNNTIAAAGKNLTGLLNTLDTVLSTNEAFSLSTRLSAAQSLTANDTLADFYEYDARNQITLWGPNGEISDYASKSWGGLVSGYYVPRWEIFIGYLEETEIGSYNETALNVKLLTFELSWQNLTVANSGLQGPGGSLQSILGELVGNEVFGRK
jgi:alpha-N-acetylglucosaminidase